MVSRERAAFLGQNIFNVEFRGASAGSLEALGTTFFRNRALWLSGSVL